MKVDEGKFRFERGRDHLTVGRGSEQSRAYLPFYPGAPYAAHKLILPNSTNSAYTASDLQSGCPDPEPDVKRKLKVDVNAGTSATTTLANPSPDPYYTASWITIRRILLLHIRFFTQRLNSF